MADLHKLRTEFVEPKATANIDGLVTITLRDDDIIITLSKDEAENLAKELTAAVASIASDDA